MRDVRSYLAALGAGNTPSPPSELSSQLQFVLFDSEGQLLTSTLRNPPALPTLVSEPTRARPIELRSGDERLIGVTVEHEGRPNLLLVSAPGLLMRVAAMVRVILIGVAWVLIVLLLGAITLVATQAICGIVGEPRSTASFWLRFCSHLQLL